MSVRTLIITASLTVALVAPAAAFAGTSRTPVFSHATTSDSTLANTATVKSNVAKLRAQLRKAQRQSAKFGAQLRAAKAGSAQLRAELRATKQLVASLQIQLADAINRANGGGGSTSTGGGGGSTQPRDCSANIDDCTPEELCNFWGMNCDQVPQPGTPPVDGQPTDGSTPTAPADGSSDSNGSAGAGSTELTAVEASVNPDDPFGYYADC